MDTSNDALSTAIESLRPGFDDHQQRASKRDKEYLRVFSPKFDPDLREHDQWADPATAEDVNHARSSFNIGRSVAELWTGLEAEPFPNVKFNETFLPTVLPELDPTANQRAVEAHKAQKLVVQRLATMREQALSVHIRRGRVARHYYDTILRKNIFGAGWLSCMPDDAAETFRFKGTYRRSDVHAVWSATDSRIPAEILICNQRLARTMHAKFPDAVAMEGDGHTATYADWYNPTSMSGASGDRQYVWVEEYWVLDESYDAGGSDDEAPSSTRVICATRVNGKVVSSETYDGWSRLPFFYFENPDIRDDLGFSDVGSVAPINDAINRIISLTQDVITGYSRPKFVGHTEASQKVVNFTDEGIIWIDPDEDLSQLRVQIDQYPVDVQMRSLFDLLARVTGLNDSVWGRIVASQNSGRALATAWRSVAARLVPRLQADEAALDALFGFMLDRMEDEDWQGAADLFNGYRDFEIEFPNQEPRDFMEVTTVAINKRNAGGLDSVGMMEEWGESSPDEMVERIRAEYSDPVLHPDKAQAYLLLQEMQQRIAQQAQQAQQQAQAQAQQLAQVQQQLAALKASPPNGAPGGQGPSPAAVAQAQVQAQQGRAPAVPPGGPPGPATQPGQGGNFQVQPSTLVQDGQGARNRVIVKYPNQ